MPTGKVKWFGAQRGYGFIVPDDGQQRQYDVNRDKGRRVSAVNLHSVE